MKLKNLHSLKREQENAIKEIENAIALVRRSDNWKYVVGPKSNKIRRKDKEQIIELSLIKLFLAWEEFIENSFLILLVNGKGKIEHIRSYLNVENEEQAWIILLGEQRRSYLEWIDPKQIKDRCNAFFHNGKPFREPIGDATVIFNHLCIIRNHIVHRSKSAKEKYQEFVRNLYGVGTRYSPGGLLMMKPPEHIGGIDAREYSTLLDFYSEMLKITITRICTAR